ncbi:MAG TPA: hypothetical protein VFA07_19240 [Chthonomonadaceae bacterium]|nr:hypothetical protein [Chthonomonadaceae bacterium]
MLRRSLMLIFLPLCLGGWLEPFASADTVAQARTAIQAAYDREDAAVRRKDVKGTLANCAPDFQFIQSDGSRGSLADARQGMVALFQKPNSFVAKTTIQKFTLQGNKAIATVKEYQMRTVVPHAKHAHPHKIVTVTIIEDTWVKHGNRWLREISRAISQKQTLDGRPVG